MSAIASQITNLTIVLQPFIQTQIKETIKAPRHWPLWGELTGDRWIPCTNGQWRGKCFHLMTSSWKHMQCTPCCISGLTAGRVPQCRWRVPEISLAWGSTFDVECMVTTTIIIIVIFNIISLLFSSFFSSSSPWLSLSSFTLSSVLSSLLLL